MIATDSPSRPPCAHCTAISYSNNIGCHSPLPPPLITSYALSTTARRTWRPCTLAAIPPPATATATTVATALARRVSPKHPPFSGRMGPIVRFHAYLTPHYIHSSSASASSSSHSTTTPLIRIRLSAIWAGWTWTAWIGTWTYIIPITALLNNRPPPRKRRCVVLPCLRQQPPRPPPDWTTNTRWFLTKRHHFRHLSNRKLHHHHHHYY